MKVLVVNHAPQVGGAERSMLSLLDGLGADVEAVLACPDGGPLATLARGRGHETVTIRAAAGSLQLHPSGTARAVRDILVAARQVAAHARRLDADVLHANSIRAGLVTGLAGRFTGLPTVVHLRDRLPPTVAAGASLRAVAATAGRVVAISDFVADGFQRATGSSRPVVVANPVDLEHFDPTRMVGPSIRGRIGLTGDEIAFGVVGQITPWKGQLDAVEAFAAVAEDNPALRLLIVGEVKFTAPTTRYDNRSYLDAITNAISRAGIGCRVSLLGERSDVAEVMHALDVLLVPSYGEPFGRVVVEAMALGTPVLASGDGGPAETISHGVDGVLLPAGDQRAWAKAMVEVASNEELRRRLVRGGRRRAAGFSVGRHVEAMTRIYADVIEARRPQPPRRG